MATDLKAFQVRLNSDKAFKSEFLNDPVKSLEAAGLILPDAAKKRLTDLVAELTSKKQPVPGSTLATGEFDIVVDIRRHN
jgi:hypothetical protein